MNKKLKFYSGLFLFSILFVVVFAVFTPTDKSIVSFHYSPAHSYRVDDLMRVTVECDANPLVTAQTDTTYQVETDSLGNIDTIGVSTNYSSFSSYKSYTVNLRKRVSTNTPPFICVANSTTKGVIDIEKAKISVSSPKQNIVVMIVLVAIVVIVYLIGLIWIIRLIVRVIRNIRRGNIFVSQMSVDLERLGILMTIFFIVGFVGQIVGYFMTCDINIENYQVVFGPINGRAWLIAGTGLMLLSQIFSMGKDLKEDVDLTV